MPLLFDRPADVYLRRLSLLATVLITATAVNTMLSLGGSLAQMHSDDYRRLFNASAAELVRFFAPPLGYTAAAALLICGRRPAGPRGQWLKLAAAIAAGTWLVTTAVSIGYPWYQWQRVKSAPLVFVGSWMMTLSTLLWTFGPLALLLRFTWGRSDAQLASDAETADDRR